ncbi:hypothetical protein GCM10023328_20910 [Modestobacter marinus]|uniref:Uncharacterized protein n=1 Tax=Modestobacter marinus TaxID=477641 RepID=A0A846LDE0_9ACTN|nr:hypothetical protein [Modestobacter marinus]NIH65677.1 hypothetical protein [Modestobacter marinus]GGL66231.1 hypothetical protein GCM10011589_23120 [Modestobacter marinus]
MPDPYRLDSAPQTPTAPAARPLRTLLWVLLALSVAGNSLASLGVLPLALNIAFGVVTAACVVALVVDHLRRR